MSKGDAVFKERQMLSFVMSVRLLKRYLSSFVIFSLYKFEQCSVYLRYLRSVLVFRLSSSLTPE